MSSTSSTTLIDADSRRESALRLGVDLRPGKPPMLRAEAAGDAPRWAAAHRDALRAAVAEHGSLLVRGLGLRDAAGTGAVFRQLAAPMIEREAYAPRRSYSPGVYSSTKWPPHQPMCMHHELSYRLEFPGLMLFACLVAPTGGGATTLADSPAVLRALPPDLIARFEQVGWLLVRNYNDEIGASVAEAFGTDDRRAVESYCRANAIRLAWQANGRLRTWQRRSAVVRDPLTGQRCWFNQVAFLNQWTMDPEVREYLVDVYGEDGLPFDTRFGNGDPITADIVRTINEVYEANTTREPWQAGDLLLVDNVRTAHAREPFEGPREVVVAMADAVNVARCSPTIEVTAG
jgi:alpha-ketoglutarate-dependent taurine dioxygenase